MAHILSFDTRVRVINALVEGTSIRATARQCHVYKRTVQDFGVAIGKACGRMHDRLVRGIRADFIEVDECWGYVSCHERRKKKGAPREWGDAYTFFAVDSETKLVPSYRVGKRTLPVATTFMADLRARVEGTPQMSVDGWPHWAEAVRRTFGHEGIDLGMTVKEYQKRKETKGNDRMYAPARVKSVSKTVIFGAPDQDFISTAIAERVNMTTRMSMRRLTRLTNAFSKKRANLMAAVDLHFFHYNFVRAHETLGTTPAIRAGIADHVWSLEEMVQAAIEEARLPQGVPVVAA